MTLNDQIRTRETQTNLFYVSDRLQIYTNIFLPSAMGCNKIVL